MPNGKKKKKNKNVGSTRGSGPLSDRLEFLNIIFVRPLPCFSPGAGVANTMQPDVDNKSGVQQWSAHGFIRKGQSYRAFVEGGGNSRVLDSRMLPMLRKYCGFSMTGIFVIPMITASGPISEDDGVLLPLETWWRGLAESSSLLMTEEEPREESEKEEDVGRKGKTRQGRKRWGNKWRVMSRRRSRFPVGGRNEIACLYNNIKCIIWSKE